MVHLQGSLSSFTAYIIDTQPFSIVLILSSTHFQPSLTTQIIDVLKLLPSTVYVTSIFLSIVLKPSKSFVYSSSKKCYLIPVHSNYAFCPLQGMGSLQSSFLLTADSQNLVAAKVNFEFWRFPCNQRAKFQEPWPAITLQEAVKALVWDSSPHSPLRALFS